MFRSDCQGQGMMLQQRLSAVVDWTKRLLWCSGLARRCCKKILNRSVWGLCRRNLKLTPAFTPDSNRFFWGSRQQPNIILSSYGVSIKTHTALEISQRPPCSGTSTQIPQRLAHSAHRTLTSATCSSTQIPDLHTPSDSSTLQRHLAVAPCSGTLQAPATKLQTTEQHTDSSTLQRHPPAAPAIKQTAL